MKRFILLGVGMLALVSAVSACASSPASSGTSTRHVDVSLAKSYNSIRELVGDSAIVVEGTVTQADSQTLTGGIPFNNWTVRVSRVLRGSSPTLTVEARLVAADDTPTLSVGAGYVLFLPLLPTAEPSTSSALEPASTS